MKILTKLTLAFLFVSLLPLTGTSIFSYWNTRQALTQKILNQLDSVATIQEHRLEDLIDQNLEKLALISSRVLLRQGLESLLRDANRGALIQQVSSPSLTLRERDRMNGTLVKAKASISDFKEISVLTLSGKVVASTDTSTIGTNHSSEDYFIKGKKENTISDFYFDRNRNLRVHLSGPIYSGSRLLGVTLVDLDPNNLTSLVKDYSGLGDTGETTLAQRTKSGDGITISPLRFNSKAALQVPVPKSALRRPMTQALLKQERLLPNSTDYRGKAVLAVSRYLPIVDWGLTVKIDRAEAFAPIYELQNSLVLTIFTSSTGVILISLYVARSFTRPVISLTQAASKISSGDLLQRVGVTSNDETGILGRAFNQMADSLLEARIGLEQQVEVRTAELRQEIVERKKAEVELRESKLFAESITENSTSIIYVLDLDTMTNVYSNHSVAQLLGYSLEQTQAMGKDFLPNVIHPDDLLDRLYRFEQFKYARDDEVIEFEQRVKHASGEWRWIWSREVVFKRRHNGTPYQIIGTAQDITERKGIEVELKRVRVRLEEQVAERTAKLQRAVTVLRLKVAEHRQAEKEIRLLQEIAQAVSESSDFHAALGVAVDKVCKVTGWNYGEAWIPRSNDTALECSPIWYGNGNSLDQFRQFSEQLTFAPGIGLPGRVWLSKQPEWIQDVSVQPQSIFLRNEAALAAGLKAGLGIPVIAGERVLAILTFFLFKSHREDERLVRVISAIATQLGSVMQRKQAEESLEASERQLRMVTDHTPVLIAYCDTERRYQFVNKGYAERFGLTREEVIGKYIPEVVGQEAYDNFREQVDSALSGQAVEFEVEVPYQRIGRHYMHIAYVPKFGPQGEVQGLIAAISDITQRKQAEEALKESEERYRILTEVSPQIVWMALPNSSVIYCNQRWFNYTGITMEQTAGDGWISAIHPEDRERVLEAWRRAVAQDKDYEIEIRFWQASNGTYRWHLVRGLPIRDANGQTVKWLGVASNIHNHKELEAQLRTLQQELEMRVQARTEELADINQRLQAILDNIGDGVIVVNKQGDFLLFNPAAEEILGTGSTTRTPDRWSEEYGLYLPDMVTPYPVEELPLTLAIRGIVADEIEVFSRSQQRPTGVWLSASARPLKDASGEITGGIAVFHDVTERKRAEENLRTYAARLAKANKELEQFNYVAAHDLKTPLRTISTRIDLLARQLAPLSQSAQHQLSRITLATLRMDSLLNDLVAYSRVGARVNPPSPTNSQAIVEQVLHQQLKQPIQESSAIVEVESLLPTVLADATQFAQVWQHLISNSLKFCNTTPQIKISATCSLTECTFCVADNGIGIPNEAQERIFGVFKRLHNQETYEGTGIGLSVVQRILDWHGGRIWVESEDGKGSKFFFTLRRANLIKD